MTDAPALLAEGLRHGYPGGPPVLDLPHACVERGAHALVLGASGRGKTTLLHIAAGLLRPTSGRVLVAGEDPAALAEAARDRWRGRTVGIVFQQLHLVPSLTAEQNVALAPALAGLPADRARVRDLLETLGVGHRARALPHAMSQGERQRVAIARALVNRPALVLADEPTSALDDARALDVARLLRRAAAETGATLVVATHDARLAPLFDHRIAL